MNVHDVRFNVYRLTVSQDYNPDCEQFPSRIPTDHVPSVLSVLMIVALCNFWRKSRSEKEILLYGECGRSINELITGERKIKLGEFPWLARIGWQYNTPVHTEHIIYVCGGSLITDQYVLTAAHCVLEKGETKVTGVLPANVTMFKVNLGAIGRTPKHSIWKRHNVYNVIERIVHDEYSGLESDIALLKLDRRVPFNDHIRPICLPVYNRNEPLAEEDIVIVSWGSANSDPPATVLSKVKLKIMNMAKCKLIFYNASPNIYIDIDESMICTNEGEGGVSCMSDSGGPLMSKLKDLWTLVGVVSLVNNETCGTLGYPNVYTSVRAYMDWIIGNLDK